MGAACSAAAEQAAGCAPCGRPACDQRHRGGQAVSTVRRASSVKRTPPGDSTTKSSATSCRRSIKLSASRSASTGATPPLGPMPTIWMPAAVASTNVFLHRLIMWINLQLDLTSVFLPLAIGASAAAFGLTALIGVFVALVAMHPARPLRIAGWSGALAMFFVALASLMVLIDWPSPDRDLTIALLWCCLILFLAGVSLVVWQGYRKT